MVFESRFRMTVVILEGRQNVADIFTGSTDDLLEYERQKYRVSPLSHYIN